MKDYKPLNIFLIIFTIINLGFGHNLKKINTIDLYKTVINFFEFIANIDEFKKKKFMMLFLKSILVNLLSRKKIH